MVLIIDISTIILVKQFIYVEGKKQNMYSSKFFDQQPFRVYSLNKKHDNFKQRRLFLNFENAAFSEKRSQIPQIVSFVPSEKVVQATEM